MALSDHNAGKFPSLRATAARKDHPCVASPNMMDELASTTWIKSMHQSPEALELDRSFLVLSVGFQQNNKTRLCTTVEWLLSDLLDREQDCPEDCQGTEGLSVIGHFLDNLADSSFSFLHYQSFRDGTLGTHFRNESAAEDYKTKTRYSISQPI